MKILIIGRGWVGKKVLQYLENKVNVDIADHIEALSILHLYDFVINCAGATGIPNVDACENDKFGALNANAIYPIELYRRCDIHGIRLAHFSSGCIYDGFIDNVNADPNFFGSIYSISKGISDSYLKNKAMVFRIRMPFTGINEPKNYLTKVYNYAKHGKLYDSGLNSLTNLDEAVEVACKLIINNAKDGAYNLVNSGSVTMRELVDIMKIDNPQWFTEDEFKVATKAARSTCVIPAYEQMSPIREQLEKAILSMKK